MHNIVQRINCVHSSHNSIVWFEFPNVKAELEQQEGEGVSCDSYSWSGIAPAKLLSWEFSERLLHFVVFPQTAEAPTAPLQRAYGAFSLLKIPKNPGFPYFFSSAFGA